MIGIYGGTFDPLHNGHIHVIKQLLLSRAVERIILVPAGEPLLRQRPVASGKDRLAMCELAVASVKGIQGSVTVSAIEVEKDGPSYAIDTAESLMKENPGKEFAWIIGSDAYRKIDQWHESERLQKMVSFIVIERPEADRDDDSELDEIDPLDIDALDISATEIRSRIAKRESISHLLPAAVLGYIESKGIYASL